MGGGWGSVGGAALFHPISALTMQPPQQEGVPHLPGLTCDLFTGSPSAGYVTMEFRSFGVIVFKATAATREEIAFFLHAMHDKALKATPYKPQVWLDCEPPPDWAKLYHDAKAGVFAKKTDNKREDFPSCVDCGKYLGEGDNVGTCVDCGTKIEDDEDEAEDNVRKGIAALGFNEPY